MDLILIVRLYFIFTKEIVKEEKTVIYCCFTRRNREKEAEREIHIQSYLGQKSGDELVDVVRFG